MSNAAEFVGVKRRKFRSTPGAHLPSGARHLLRDRGEHLHLSSNAEIVTNRQLLSPPPRPTSNPPRNIQQEQEIVPLTMTKAKHNHSQRPPKQSQGRQSPKHTHSRQYPIHKPAISSLQKTPSPWMKIFRPPHRAASLLRMDCRKMILSLQPPQRLSLLLRAISPKQDPFVLWPRAHHDSCLGWVLSPPQDRARPHKSPSSSSKSSGERTESYI